MYKIIPVLTLLLITAIHLQAQQQTFDIATFSVPKGFKKDSKPNLVSYSITDEKKNTFCQLVVFQSTASKGNISDDFASEWQQLVVTPFQVVDSAQTSGIQEVEGWKIINGVAKFSFNNGEALTSLTTISGYGICISLQANTNSADYTKHIEEFIASVDLKKPEVNTVTQNTNTTKPSSPAVKDNFAFNTTNFDDGWTSVIKEDWVEVTKGNLVVLLHYANENVKPANTDANVMCEAAWNVLVAPRYSSIANYQLSPGIIDYERPYYTQADLTDKATGEQKFVVLFKKGNTCWMEFIMPDKNTFIQTFGLDITQLNYYSESAVWNKMITMNGYNKFAIASSDFKGNWSDHFASNTYYANVYTGLSAGMSSYSSSQSFEFSAGQQYKWRLVATNSYGGATSFAQAKGQGTFKVLSNWQIHFSELEGKPKIYDAYFTAIRGGRILWMNDAKYPGSGIFTGFSLSK